MVWWEQTQLMLSYLSVFCSSVIWVTGLILVLLCCDVKIWWENFFVPQAMKLQLADLWYLSSFVHSRSVETSRSSFLLSQHSSLAVESAAQQGLSSLRYLIVSFCFTCVFALLHISLFTPKTPQAAAGRTIWTFKMFSWHSPDGQRAQLDYKVQT